jgi:hypothetical protein
MYNTEATECQRDFHQCCNDYRGHESGRKNSRHLQQGKDDPHIHRCIDGCHVYALLFKDASYVYMCGIALGNRRRVFLSCIHGICPRICRIFRRYRRQHLSGIHGFGNGAWTARSGPDYPFCRVPSHVSLSGLYMPPQPLLLSVIGEKKRLCWNTMKLISMSLLVR